MTGEGEMTGAGETTGEGGEISGFLTNFFSLNHQYPNPAKTTKSKIPKINFVLSFSSMFIQLGAGVVEVNFRWGLRKDWG